MSVVAARLGDVRVRIVDPDYESTKSKKDGSIVLSFDEDRDIATSAALLHRTRLLDFEVTADEHANRLAAGDCEEIPCMYAYLGRDLADWDEDLAIRLEPKRYREPLVWRADRKAIHGFKRRHWCAARASVTICESPQHAILRKDGTSLQTRISLGYENPWYAEIYRQTRLALQGETLSADITSSIQDFFTVIREAREKAHGSPSLELYHRLRVGLPAYEEVLSTILANPLRQPVRSVRSYRLAPEDAGRLHSERAGQMQVIHVAQSLPRGGRSVPTAFTAAEHALSTNNPANYYVRQSVTTVATWLDIVSRSLAAYVESERESVREFFRVRGEEVNAQVEDLGPNTSYVVRPRIEGIRRHLQAHRRLQNDRDRFRRFEASLPHSEHPSGVFAEGASALAFDPRYAELRRITDRLSHTFDYADTSEDRIPFEVESFQEIYQRWCFVRIIDALQEIGFEFTGSEGRRTTPFYHNPVPHQINAEMVHPRLPGRRLFVWYERTYPIYSEEVPHLYGVETRYAQGRTRYDAVDPARVGKLFGKAKRSPDIALEIFNGADPVPLVVTLDPTLGNSKSKYDYRESIRSLVDGDLENDQRESRRIVTAAWGVRPGGEHTVTFLEHAAPQNPDYREGFIVLRPNHESSGALSASLAAILEFSEAVPRSSLTSTGASPSVG
jgi:hypothetical protein